MAAPQAIVVGAGPVGLFLGCLLAQRGVEVALLERSERRHPHSRSIGVHPPSLHLMAEIGVADALVAGGAKVRAGRAFGAAWGGGTRPLGTLRFDALPPPYRFVLTLPQHETERILEARLEGLAPGALRRGVEVVGFDQDESSARLSVRAAGAVTRLTAPLVVACDGAHSLLRRLAGIPFSGAPYPDSYLMGDVADDGALGDDAAVFLPPGGVVESFPLPGRRRRWVVKTDARIAEPSAALLAALVRERVGHELAVETTTGLSAFGVQSFRAERFARGRLFLAGDSAHLISPIGGQGMNLGWHDAHRLASDLAAITLRGADPQQRGDRYHRARAPEARRAAARAELNMRLGRATRFPEPRDAILKAVLATPLSRVAARLFTMWPPLAPGPPDPAVDGG